MAKETTLKEISEMLTHVVKHMATKDDIIDLRRDILTVQTQVNSIEQQLRETKTEVRLGALEKKSSALPAVSPPTTTLQALPFPPPEPTPQQSQHPPRTKVAQHVRGLQYS
jgi:hypothetical protein